MKLRIVCDSSCDLVDYQFSNPDLSFAVVPFVLRFDDQEFIDNKELDVNSILPIMEKSVAPTTACPSPYLFEEEMAKEDNVIVITISSNLSGSYNSASTAALSFNDKKIYILNSISAGPGLILLVQKIEYLFNQGLSFEEIVDKIEEYKKMTSIVFALSSFDNLVKNGRMNKIVGFVAKKLSFWGIGIGSSEGKIEIIDKVRGSNKMIERILSFLEERNVRNKIVISHCFNEELTNQLVRCINEKFPNVDVEIHQTRGLCSFYAEREGVIVAFE